MGTGALLVRPAHSRQANATSRRVTVPGPNAVFIRIRQRRDTAAVAALARRDRHDLDQSRRRPRAAWYRVLRPAEIVNYRADGHHTRVSSALGLAAGAVDRARAHPDRVRPPTPTRPRPPQDPRLHPPTTRGRQSPGNRRSPSPSASSSAYPSASSSDELSGTSSPTRSTPYPNPPSPALTITLIAVGALALANLVAAIPARQAARTPTALLLHAE